jgi:hypothetical protein
VSNMNKVSLAMDVNEILHVTHAEVATERWDPHVQYVIRTRSSENTSILYVTRRRARYFTILHGQLKRMGYKNLPILPGTKGINITKMITGKNFDCSAVQLKRLAFEKYLRELISLADVRQSSELKTFLGCTPCSELDSDGSPSSRSRSSSSMSERSVDLMIVGNNSKYKRQEQQALQKKTPEIEDTSTNNSETISTSLTLAKQTKEEEHNINNTNLFSAQYISMLITEIALLKDQLQKAKDKIKLLEK